MKRGPYLSGLALLTALTCWTAAARAQNPKITLELQNASAPEVVAALANTAGVTLRFQPSFGSDAASGEQQQQRRATFRWKEVPLAQAIREASEKFGLKLRRAEAGYFMHFISGPDDTPAPLARFEKDGVELRVRQIATETVRRSGGREDLTVSGGGQMMLTFDAQLRDGDGAMIYGVRNVTAKDERGNVLVADYGRVFSPPTRDLYPDEWRGGLTLTGPDPSARKLLWLEGDLMKSKVFEPVELKVPLPLAETGGKAEVGLVRVEVTKLLPTPGEAGAGVGSPNGPRIEYRLVTRQGTFLYAPNGEYTVSPVLVGASGRRYTAYQTFGGFNRISEEQKLVREFQSTLPAITEPLVSADFSLVRKEGFEPLVHFRMENVPLPVETPNLARRVGTLEQSSVPLEKRPFYQQDGGSVLSAVVIGKTPARAGTLWLGLAPAGKGEAGGVEWYEQTVDGGGLALLSQLKPGRYRLLRIYRPASADTSPPGEWENSEVEVQVRAGKVLEAPPLRFEPARSKR